MLLLWFILISIVRPLLFLLHFIHLFRIASWPSSVKEQSYWLSTCPSSFSIWCWGMMRNSIYQFLIIAPLSAFHIICFSHNFFRQKNNNFICPHVCLPWCSLAIILAPSSFTQDNTLTAVSLWHFLFGHHRRFAYATRQTGGLIWSTPLSLKTSGSISPFTAMKIVSKFQPLFQHFGHFARQIVQILNTLNLLFGQNKWDNG